MIPVNEPMIGQKELDYVSECLKTGWISSSGDFIERFEAGWATYCGMGYGVAVSNGTVALEMAVRCLGLQPGDEVIMPTFTIISCAQAVIANGGVPVLVDSEPGTWCMDVNQLESKVSDRTRAVMPVHIYGHPVDMDPILEFVDKHSLSIIEDAAEAHGAEYLRKYAKTNEQWQKCGSFGDLSTFSFYANKPVTTGEGGMVLTNSSETYQKLKSLRNLYFNHDRRFLHYDLGYNFRMTNIQAALGVAQVERIDDIVTKKRAIGERYKSLLSDIPGIALPAEMPWAKNIYWMFGLVLEDSIDLTAEEFAEQLHQREVQTRPFFLGMHEQPALHKLGLFQGERHPVAENLARRGLYIPSGLSLTEEVQDKVVQAIKDILF